MLHLEVLILVIKLALSLSIQIFHIFKAMIKDMIYPTRKTLLPSGRFLSMKAMLVIHLVTLFQRVHGMKYLESTPIKLISASMSSIYFSATAARVIDEDFATYCQTEYELNP